MTDEMRAEMNKMREESDKIQEEAVMRINKSLSKKQGAAWKKLLGEAFDFSKLQGRGRGPGGPGGPGGPNGNGDGGTSAAGPNDGQGGTQPKNASARKSARNPQS